VSAAASLADRVRGGAADAIDAITRHVLPVRPDNVLPRPWGGRRLFAWKGLQEPVGDEAYGEVFEVSADRRDAESAAHPSIVVLPDGSEIPLPDLLDIAGSGILGSAIFEEHGPNLPLLPKTLDIHELLSLQAHPPGSPEAYYVLDADPGATLRIGFVRDLKQETLRETFVAGREAQESLLEDLRAEADLHDLQRALSAALLEAGGPDGLVDRVRPLLADSASEPEARTLLSCLAGAWRQTLDLLTEVPAEPGTMILNATPSVEGSPRSAEVHALGNPEKRAVLLFEVRRPAPTYRAWDHVRFPLRDIEIDKALASMSLGARTAESFVAPPRPIPGRPGAFRSAVCEAFVVEHLRPSGSEPVSLPPDPSVRTLHVVRGTAVVHDHEGRECLRLERGRSAVIPAGADALGIAGAGSGTEALCVTLPPRDGA
jgi:mannose-6-phosphate isomerase class I